MPNKFINKLDGKRVLVFGGTSGIGFAVVEGALEQGATVIITGSNQGRLDATVERLTTSYPDIPKDRITTCPCDLADQDQETNIKKLFDTITDNGKNKLNHIVYTAGDSIAVGSGHAIKDYTPETFRASAQIRTFGVFTVAKLLPAYLEQSADSSLTMTSGARLQRPIPGWALLVAALGAMEAAVGSFAVELAPVRVNIVSPGAIMTELLKKTPEHLIEGFKEMTAVKKVGMPEDTAEAYLYCMKDGFVTGSTIHTNGGFFLV